MPIHLTGIETVEALPDPANYEPGYPVIHNGTLKAVNAARDAFDIVAGGGGGGGIATLGHPAQKFLHQSHGAGRSLHQRWNFDFTFQPGDGGGYVDQFEQVTFSQSEGTYDLPQFANGSSNLPQRVLITFRWYAPVAGTFNLDYEGETGSFDYTVTINGVAGATFNNSPDGTYSVAIEPGLIEAVILIENVSGGVTGSQMSIKPYVTPDVTPSGLFFDDFGGVLIQYDGQGGYAPAGSALGARHGGAVPVVVDSSVLLGGAAVTAGSQLNASGVALERSLVALGEMNASLYVVNQGVVLGFAARGVAFPNLGGAMGYGYDSTAIGADAEAWTEGTAVGPSSVAGPLGATLAGEAWDECLALGYGSSAQTPRVTFSPTGTVTAQAASGTGGRGTFFYHVRGVDVDGYPLTRWDYHDTQALAGEDAVVTWGTTGWPTGTTHVEVRRTGANEYQAFMRAPVADGALTDNFTADDRLPREREFAFQDWYGWARSRRSIAIGMYTRSWHANSVIIDNDMGSTEYDDQFALGNAGNLVDHKGGEVRRVESVTAAHVCDSNDRSNVVLANASTAAFNVTLPAAQAGRTLHIKKSDGGANAVTVVTPGAQTIDGAASLALDTAYESATLVSDGTNWFTI